MDLVLSSGKEITIDLHKISVREWRDLVSDKGDQEQEDELTARICGLTVDEMLDLPQPDYRKLLVAIVKKAKEPLADPS